MGGRGGAAAWDAAADRVRPGTAAADDLAGEHPSHGRRRGAREVAAGAGPGRRDGRRGSARSGPGHPAAVRSARRYLGGQRRRRLDARCRLPRLGPLRRRDLRLGQPERRRAGRLPRGGRAWGSDGQAPADRHRHPRTAVHPRGRAPVRLRRGRRAQGQPAGRARLGDGRSPAAPEASRGLSARTDLVVADRRDIPGTAHPFAGPVAHSLLHHAHGPVAIVPSGWPGG